MNWTCPECAEEENGAEDAVCQSCDAPRPAAEGAAGEPERFAGLVVALVLELTEAPGGKKLKVCKLDIGKGSEAVSKTSGRSSASLAHPCLLLLRATHLFASLQAITVVTNAPNVNLGSRVIVATLGAKVESDGSELVVKKMLVGGVMSEGMLCDAPMLGWTGGGAGTAALVPPSCALGSKPPEKRLRLDGQ